MNLKKYENHEMIRIAKQLLIEDAPLLLEEVKRLRLLFRELINDMSADDYMEWCNRIGCPDGLEIEVLKEEGVDLSSFKQRIANGERAKDVIETYYIIGKLDRKELLEYEERFNEEE
jgi:hypothetical protein